jgi:hypothetical protein
VKQMKKKRTHSFLIRLLLITLAILIPGSNVNSHTVDEYLLKSEIIYRICKFTKWPNPPDREKPFTISILGETTDEEEIKLPRGVTIDKRKILVRKIDRLSEINGSDVLFITSSQSDRLDAILDYIGSKPILTVGDTSGFAQRGVILNLYVQRNKVKFEINYDACKKASLQMHSQLFAVGRVIRTKKSLKRKRDGAK